jgi:hypothetical protein
MFFDWLTMYQDHPDQLPMIGDRVSIDIDTITGEHLGVRQPTLTHEGSFCTSIQVRVSGNRVTVSGNPSRYNRLDNLFGFTSLDDCVAVYNRVLLSLGLPPFTKCTRVFFRQGEDGKRFEKFSDGGTITELHITTNRAVGEGGTTQYIKALSTQRYHNSIPRLHTNGNTCDWLSAKGKASLIYPSVYNKAAEMVLHQLPKLLRKFGADSDQVRDLQRVIEYCNANGVTRHEQKLKAAFLRRHDFRFWGLFKAKRLQPFHDEFLAIGDRLQVNAMTLESIADKLLRLGVVNSRLAANTTTLYALQWMAGEQFDLSKSQVQTHRARLRKVGIDIADACDLTKFSTIQVRAIRAIEVADLPIPEWYQLPSVPSPLRLAA